jgi:methylated-DNA-[protein]-cysteine S-methyltransferase
MHTGDGHTGDAHTGDALVGVLNTAVLDSPCGALTFVASDTGLRAVLWPNERPGRVVFAEPLVENPDHPVLVAAMTQMGEYFAGARTTFEIPLDLRGTPFQVKAWRSLAGIPYGTTSTYAEQAARLGDAKKARAVGAANGRNPVSIVLPCHRVVGADGSLTGFAGGLDTKRYLLALERDDQTAS